MADILLDEANAGEALTQRYGRYDGTPFMRPAYYPDAEVLVDVVQASSGPMFMASLYIMFGEQGVRFDALGHTPREACQSLHAILKSGHAGREGSFVPA